MNHSNSYGSFYRDVAGHAGSVAAEWYTAALSWFGDWLVPTQTVGVRCDAARIAESLITELVQQGRVLEDKKRQAHKDALAASGVADYSWLVTEKPLPYDISDIDRLELEQLCQKVPPESCGRVVREFRSALLREPSTKELPNIMRAIVRRIVFEQRNNTSSSSSGGVTSWLGHSLTNLKSRFVASSASADVGDNLELSVNVLNSMELGSLDDDVNL